MTFGIGETILREGEEIRNVFIIGSGQVKVLKSLHEVGRVSYMCGAPRYPMPRKITS